MFYGIADLLDIKGKSGGTKDIEVFFKPRAYRKAADYLLKLDKDVSLIYKEKGLKGLNALPFIGEKMSKEIAEYLKKKKIKRLEELSKDTAIQQVITHYFQTKGLSLSDLKDNAKKKKIIYSRFTKPAEQLITLAGSVEKAKEAINKVASWANSRKLDYAIETVFKKWLELDRLKPKEVVKKPFFRGNPMVWSQTKKKWFVIDESGTWLEFAGKQIEVEWRITE